MCMNNAWYIPEFNNKYGVDDQSLFLGLGLSWLFVVFCSGVYPASAWFDSGIKFTTTLKDIAHMTVILSLNFVFDILFYFYERTDINTHRNCMKYQTL